MKRIEPTTLSRNYPAVLLFEPDLDRLAEVLRTGKQEARISYTFADTEFDSIEELREHKGDVIRRLEVESRQSEPYGYCSVTFGQSDVRVYATSGFTLQVHQLGELLNQHRRLLSGIPNGLWLAVGIVIWVVLLSIALLASNSGIFGLTGAPRFAVNMIGNVLAFAVIIFGPKIRRNLLILRKPHDHHTFVKRHAEAIWRGVFALLGGLLGAALVRLWK